ncbi:hypothetical protein IFR05_015889 [Cadophora sp. M221]|nr:hypothetical protein IFR05_015889 [Cadophora sp. M221]
MANGPAHKGERADTTNLHDNEAEIDLEIGSTDIKENRQAEPAQKEEKDPNLIDWNGPSDPENPQNWTASKKWIVVTALSLMTICVTFASSVFSTAAVQVAQLYDVSTEVTTLGLSLFVAGFAFGPLVFGPTSEVFGRKSPLFIGYFCFAIFQIPVAVSQNLYTILITRFIGGCFACAPLAIGGGLIADMFGPVDRGVGICVFCSATFIGPMIGPILGGFITQSYLGWRWTAWFTLIMATIFGTLGYFTIPETSHSRILQKRAKKLRFETKNWGIYSQADTVKIDLKTILKIYVTRPLQMLILEPILLLITIYMSLVYGILYLFFLAYPISFQRERGWNQGVGALPFLGIMIGISLGAFTIAYLTKTRYARIIEKKGRAAPEERLPPMILGSLFLPIGLFWFAWTSDPDVSWVPQVIAGIPIGWGFLMIFLQGLNYIIDVYLWLANSAISANTFLRSLAAAGFPMFATAMYNRLGVDWATSLLAFLCVAMIPAPILFYIYGEKIRGMSKFSPKI